MATVLLLGAASDMAIAIARKFASHGYNVQLAGRNATRLEPMQSDIAVRYNVMCTLHEFDALDFDTHPRFFHALEVKPDVSVVVFGYLGENEKARTEWTECARTIHTNYTGAVSILNVISEFYRSQKKGCIVGISSVAGERGRQSNFIYGSAKAGFTAYLSGLRNRMFKEGVHVATIQPGFVYTRMTENLPLPALLTAKPEAIGVAVYNAVINRKNVVYVKWFWRWIMFIIKSIPEPMFKKMKL